MDFLLQIAAAAAVLAVYYMYEYWYVTLFAVFLAVVGMITVRLRSDRDKR